MALACKIRGHSADRGIARHDGEDYWSVCRRCGVEMIRDPDGWREPTDDERKAHVLHVEQKSALDDAAGLGAALPDA